MKEGDRGEEDALERIRPKIMPTLREDRDWERTAYGSVCVSADYNLGIWGGSVTVYVYVWGYIISSVWTLKNIYTVKKG